MIRMIRVRAAVGVVPVAAAVPAGAGGAAWLRAVVGDSMGVQQPMQWAVSHPIGGVGVANLFGPAWDQPFRFGRLDGAKGRSGPTRPGPAADTPGPWSPSFRRSSSTGPRSIRPGGGTTANRRRAPDWPSVRSIDGSWIFWMATPTTCSSRRRSGCGMTSGRRRPGGQPVHQPDGRSVPRLPRRPAPASTGSGPTSSGSRAGSTRGGGSIKCLEAGDEIAPGADDPMDTISVLKVPLLVEAYRQVEAGAIGGVAEQVVDFIATH